jgi:hypothetical protein
MSEYMSNEEILVDDTTEPTPPATTETDGHEAPTGATLMQDGTQPTTPTTNPNTTPPTP